MNNNQEQHSIWMKIRFYLMSLWLLFALIVFLTADIPMSFAPDAKFIGVIPLLKRNVLPAISLVLCFVSWCCMKWTEFEWKGATNPPYKIRNVRNENYEYLTFLTTYIIPLICIDLSNVRYVIVLGVLLVLIGSIFIKMDLYYGNPTLALMGYHLYRADAGPYKDLIMISKDRLYDSVDVEWISIGEYVWITKKNK